MFGQQSVLNIFLLCTVAAQSLHLLDVPVSNRCVINEILENRCKKCVCSTSNVYVCTDVNCDKESNALKFKRELTVKTCIPKIIYKDDKISCLCTEKGFWPNQQCLAAFGTLINNTDTELKCKPNGYITIDCNVCRCDAEGKVDTKHCTKNNCLETKRRSNAELPGSRCIEGNWYSLASCQICFCNNKNELVCNTGNTKSGKLKLGAYQLSDCGVSFLEEVHDLYPKQYFRLDMDDKVTQEEIKTPLVIESSPESDEVNSAPEENNANETKRSTKHSKVNNFNKKNIKYKAEKNSINNNNKSTVKTNKNDIRNKIYDHKNHLKEVKTELLDMVSVLGEILSSENDRSLDQ